MIYRRDILAGEPQAAIDAETEHVRDHLAAVADPNDDPGSYRDEVRVRVVSHAEHEGWLSIIGELDEEPDAPYLAPDYDPSKDDDGTRYLRYEEAGAFPPAHYSEEGQE